MRTVGSKGLLLFAATFLLTCSSRAVTESPDAHPAKSWLDNAVSAKRCPATPVNVPASDKEGVNSLLKRITISGDKLYINGTDDPDHIVVSSGGSSQLVRVAWNGKQLGRFGPIKKIELRGHGGDDVLIVKSSVTLPVLIDGGSGDDCIQGGSGADQLFGSAGDDVLIAGTDRPALNVGSGSDRIVVPHRMGTLRYASSADSGILRMLGEIYDLEPVKKGSPSISKGAQTPIILGSADLGDEQLASSLLSTRAAAQAVVLTNGTRSDSEKLRLLLGHPNAAQGLQGSKTGFGAGEPVPLIFYRTAPRPGTKANHYSTGVFMSLSGPLDDGTIASLSQIFSATAIVPRAPGDSASNDLTTLADSYFTLAENKNSYGSSSQVSDTVFDVRSFLNKSDFYYVEQEVDYRSATGQPGGIWISQAANQVYFMQPSEIQTTPASTTCTTSTTSGVSWNIGGSAGFNVKQIANATLTGGVSVSNSETISCPSITIENLGNPNTGLTEWKYALNNPGADHITFDNQWIWNIPFTSYQTGQTTISIGSEASSEFFGPDCGNDDCGGVTTGITPVIPVPFGDTFALQQPAITSVNPTCVYEGDKFAINGTGFYPSLVSSVLIGGKALPLANYSFAVPKNKPGPAYISVVAPRQEGDDQSVVVESALGQSNDNVTVTIPYLYCSDSDAGGKKK